MLSVGGVFEKHALDTISFPGFHGSFRGEKWSYYVDFIVEASRESIPLPIPLSSIYGNTMCPHFKWLYKTVWLTTSTAVEFLIVALP